VNWQLVCALCALIHVCVCVCVRVCVCVYMGVVDGMYIHAYSSSTMTIQIITEAGGFVWWCTTVFGIKYCMCICCT